MTRVCDELEPEFDEFAPEPVLELDEHAPSPTARMPDAATIMTLLLPSDLLMSFVFPVDG
ncbi:MAG TPA: hypothetical protein VG253_08045 [Streptosporangiaceae bacterium]|jgi:hypothetical protein|nr:hypothetical protein [Streptosporangiaceae bacterium]